MNKFKMLSGLFGVVALLLSHIMCAHVAYKYADMACGVAHRAFSASEDVAFLLAIPYTLGIALCIALWLVFRKKVKGGGK